MLVPFIHSTSFGFYRLQYIIPKQKKIIAVIKQIMIIVEPLNTSNVKSDLIFFFVWGFIVRLVLIITFWIWKVR